MKDFLTPKVVKLLANFSLVNHLSRQKCALQAILAMIKTRSVQLSELGFELNDEVKPASNERRLQGFFKDATLNESEFAFLLSLFLSFGKVDLSMDRTEWDFGKTQVNLLVISGSCQGMSIPLFIDFLDNKSGNSNTEDRIAIFKKVILLLGGARINSFSADREFIGEDWFKYLLGNEINFFIRIPKSYKIEVNGVVLKAPMLLKSRQRCHIDNVKVLGISGLSVEMTCCKNKKGEDDYLIVLTNTVAYQAMRNYKKRWSIEAMFQDFKKQGFNLEESHLNEPYKIVKLMYLVSVAYCLCLHAGFLYEKGKGKILKKHGYRAYSLFRKGLDFLRRIFCKKNNNQEQVWHDLIDRFIHLALIKLMRTS